MAVPLLLSLMATGADAPRGTPLILDVLQRGRVDLSPGVAAELPRSQSELQIRRIGLELDGYRIRAAFRDKTRRVASSGRVNVAYKDAYYNEVAAYVVAGTLGLNMVPATVLREIGIKDRGIKPSSKLRQGSLQLWIENSVVEYDLATGVLAYPGNLATKYRQLSEIRVFDCLIGNVDRHAGNVLIDLTPRSPLDPADANRPPLAGKLWAIDHSRAFHGSARINTRSCNLDRLADRPVSLRFIEGMRGWEPERVIAALRRSGLSDRQLDSLHVDAMSSRLKKLLGLLEQMRLASGLVETDFYSSGYWHRVQ